MYLWLLVEVYSSWSSFFQSLSTTFLLVVLVWYCALVGWLVFYGFFFLFFVYRIFLEQALCSEAESNGTGFQSRCSEFSGLHIYINHGDLYIKFHLIVLV